MAGGIVNPNGTIRKPEVVSDGNIFTAGVAAHQHGTVRVSGLSYNSPFTESDISVFPGGQTLATQPQLPATKEAQPGQTVPVVNFRKVYPTETPQFFSTTVPRHTLVNRAGGPSTTADTPANPNAMHRQKQAPPPGGVSQTPVSHLNLASFSEGGATIGSHANSSSDASRWDTIKTGAAG